MDDELRQRGVERVVGKRQLLCPSLAHVDPGIALARGENERLGRVRRRHRIRTEARDQLLRQRPGAATDVDNSLS